MSPSAVELDGTTVRGQALKRAQDSLSERRGAPTPTIAREDIMDTSRRTLLAAGAAAAAMAAAPPAVAPWQPRQRHPHPSVENNHPSLSPQRITQTQSGPVATRMRRG